MFIGQVYISNLNLVRTTKPDAIGSCCYHCRDNATRCSSLDVHQYRVRSLSVCSCTMVDFTLVGCAHQLRKMGNDVAE